MRVHQRLPEWIRMSIPGGGVYTHVKRAIVGKNLHTVCLEAKCPNIGDCFCSGRAAFLIMGNICTRNCLYCAVTHGKPEMPDADEPECLAAAIKELGLSYAVITSVTRDDLADGGAAHFASCVAKVKERSPQCNIEVLIPDFRYADSSALDLVLASSPDVINHNIETVRTFFPELRPQGNYAFSLSVIKRISDAGAVAKSGLMVGFGETDDDIAETLDDLLKVGCRILTVGQYLRASKDGFPVRKYYRPEEFDAIASRAKTAGFEKVLAGPLVRSSYHAEKTFRKNI